MATNEMNDAPVLDQVREHWQKMAALLLFKLGKPGQEVVITTDDIIKLQRSPANIIFCHGRTDTFALKLVTEDEAERLIAFQDRQVGTS